MLPPDVVTAAAMLGVPLLVETMSAELTGGGWPQGERGGGGGRLVSGRAGVAAAAAAVLTGGI